MKNNDKGMRDLLKLLKTHPDAMNALVFDPRSIRRVLRGKARQLALGVDTQAFLSYVARPGNGGPIALCLRRTALLCAKATVRMLPLCPKGSRLPCPKGSRLLAAMVMPPPCPKGSVRR